MPFVGMPFASFQEPCSPKLYSARFRLKTTSKMLRANHALPQGFVYALAAGRPESRCKRRESQALSTKIGGSMAGGMELHFFGLWNLKFRSLKLDENRSFCWNSRIFLQISDSEKYFSGSGKWQFHTPPIHTFTKCRPTRLVSVKWDPYKYAQLLLTGRGTSESKTTY